MVMQRDVSFFLRLHLYSFFHEYLVIRTKKRRDLILVEQIVDILEHSLRRLHVVVCEQERALLELTTRHLQHFLHVVLPLLQSVTLALLRRLKGLIHKEDSQLR